MSRARESAGDRRHGAIPWPRTTGLHLWLGDRRCVSPTALLSLLAPRHHPVTGPIPRSSIPMSTTWPMLRYYVVPMQELWARSVRGRDLQLCCMTQGGRALVLWGTQRASAGGLPVPVADH